MINAQIDTALCDEVDEGLLQGLVSIILGISYPFLRVSRSLKHVLAASAFRAWFFA